MQDISEQAAPIRRVVDSIGSVAGARAVVLGAVRWRCRGRRTGTRALGVAHSDRPAGHLAPKAPFRGRIAALSLIGLLGAAWAGSSTRRSEPGRPANIAANGIWTLPPATCSGRSFCRSVRGTCASLSAWTGAGMTDFTVLLAP